MSDLILFAIVGFIAFALTARSILAGRGNPVINKPLPPEPWRRW